MPLFNQHHSNHRKAKRNRKLSASRRTRVARPEWLELRNLLSGTGFLQGTAFVDTGDHTLDANDAYLPHATVLLYNFDSNGYSNDTPLAATTTNQYGQYTFGNLQPGHYHIVEIPPAGYTNSGTQAESQVNPASSSGMNSIDVNLLDPSTLTATISSNNIGSLPKDSFNYKLFGKTQDSQGFTLSTLAFQAPVQINGGNTQSMMSVDLVDFLNAGTNTFPVSPGTSTPPFGPGSGVVPPGKKPVEENVGRIAYLMNHYGTQSLDQTHAVGLQMAIWKLVVDTNDNMTGGNFKILNVQPNSQLALEVGQAKTYIDDSAGKNEVAEFLDATNGGTVSSYTSNAPDNGGLQSLVATDSLNFGNMPVPSSGDVDMNVRADGKYVAAGGTVGFTITLNAEAASTGVSFADVLPAGPGNDIVWSKDSDPSNAFTLSGALGSQVLTLNASESTLPKGAKLTVHVTGTATANDVGLVADNASAAPNPDRDGDSTAFVVVVPANSNNNPPGDDDDDGRDDDDGGDRSWWGGAQGAAFNQAGDDDSWWW